MSEWSVAEAKARWSELLERAEREPQVVRRRGRRTAVVVSAATWDALGRELGALRDPAAGAVARFLSRAETLRRHAETGDLGLELPPRDAAAPVSPFDED
jgi:prevent-host-death family protein